MLGLPTGLAAILCEVALSLRAHIQVQEFLSLSLGDGPAIILVMPFLQVVVCPLQPNELHHTQMYWAL